MLSKWEAIWTVTNQTRVITYGCQCAHSALAVTFLPACGNTAWQHYNDLVGRCTRVFERHFASHLESTIILQFSQNSKFTLKKTKTLNKHACFELAELRRDEKFDHSALAHHNGKQNTTHTVNELRHSPPKRCQHCWRLAGVESH